MSAPGLQETAGDLTVLANPTASNARPAWNTRLFETTSPRLPPNTFAVSRVLPVICMSSGRFGPSSRPGTGTAEATAAESPFGTRAERQV